MALKPLAQLCVPSLALFDSIAKIAAQCTAPIFSAPPEYAVGLRPTSVAIGDFNGDNKPDLVTANSQSSNISIVLGDGVGGFGPPKHFPVASEPGSVAVDDFNKDGKATANASGPDVCAVIQDRLSSLRRSDNFIAVNHPLFLTVRRGGPNLAYV